MSTADPETLPDVHYYTTRHKTNALLYLSHFLQLESTELRSHTAVTKRSGEYQRSHRACSRQIRITLLRELEFTKNIPNQGREIIIPKCDRQQSYESRNSSFVQSAGLFLLLLLDVLLRR